MTKSPEPEEPQDSKGSPPITDNAAPQPDPDAWIQVEKRHRQTKVQMRRGPVVLLSPPLPDSSCSSCLHSHLSPGSVSVTTPVFSAPLPPQPSKLTSSLQLSTSCSQLKYLFLSSFILPHYRLCRQKFIEVVFLQAWLLRNHFLKCFLPHVRFRIVATPLQKATRCCRPLSPTRKNWTSCSMKRWSRWPPGKTSSQTGPMRTTRTMSWTTRT